MATISWIDNDFRVADSIRSGIELISHATAAVSSRVALFFEIIERSVRPGRKALPRNSSIDERNAGLPLTLRIGIRVNGYPEQK